MLKQKKIGLIVWGSIFLVFGLIFFYDTVYSIIVNKYDRSFVIAVIIAAVFIGGGIPAE